MIHKLKTWPAYFHATARRDKTFEVRKDDRNFQVGDILHLQEYDSCDDVYSGNVIRACVTYVLKGGSFGIDPNYVVLAIEVISVENENPRKTEEAPKTEEGIKELIDKVTQAKNKYDAAFADLTIALDAREFVDNSLNLAVGNAVLTTLFEIAEKNEKISPEERDKRYAQAIDKVFKEKDKYTGIASIELQEIAKHGV